MLTALLRTSPGSGVTHEPSPGFQVGHCPGFVTAERHAEGAQLGAAPRGRSSCTDGHMPGLGFRRVVVKIALRPSMRLPMGCTLAACLTGERPCAEVSGRCGLVGRVRDGRGLACVEVRRRLAPDRSLLVALGHGPVLEGVSRCTSIGRVHVLVLGPAFGVGQLPPEAVVRFVSGMRRFWTAAHVRVSPPGRALWGWPKPRACWWRRRRGSETAGVRTPCRWRRTPVVDLADSVSPRPGFDRRRPASIACARSVATASAVG